VRHLDLEQHLARLAADEEESAALLLDNAPQPPGGDALEWDNWCRRP